MKFEQNENSGGNLLLTLEVNPQLFPLNKAILKSILSNFIHTINQKKNFSMRNNIKN